jgi:hypothetical protein
MDQLHKQGLDNMASECHSSLKPTYTTCLTHGFSQENILSTKNNDHRHHGQADYRHGRSTRPHRSNNPHPSRRGSAHRTPSAPKSQSLPRPPGPAPPTGSTSMLRSARRYSKGPKLQSRNWVVSTLYSVLRVLRGEWLRILPRRSWTWC